MKAKVTALLVVTVALSLAVMSVHRAAGSTQQLVQLKVPRQLASVQSSSWCEKNPTHRTVKQVPVWLHLVVQTATTGNIVHVGVPVAPFRRVKHHIHRMRKHEFGAWSGCLAVRLFTKGHVPTQMCAAKVLNIDPSSDNCGPVQSQGSGEKFVFISMTAPDPTPASGSTPGGANGTTPGG